MTRRNRNKEAAAILRGLKDRISRLEQAQSDEGIPNLLRSVTDRLGTSDDVDVTVREGGSFEFDASSFDGDDEWA